MKPQPAIVPSAKRLLAAFAVGVFLLGTVSGLAACGGDDTGATESTGASETTSAGADSTFTLVELAQFDGKNGAAAYVAVDGVVYDVTGSRDWPEGAHDNCGLGAMAGRDLSEVITRAPANMRTLLEDMPVVGTLAP
ncbi:MAG: hypothetical protein JW990_21540 [Thermoleophilia bacterium]|nr:hypothetical protein [Thermoleophilia bacterium]